MTNARKSKGAAAKKAARPLTAKQQERKWRKKFFTDIYPHKRADAERAASTHARNFMQESRGQSLVQERRKDREKPYRSEPKKAGIGKKRKTNYRSTYHQAPQGYTFLPIGTNDLADRCKELSRQRSFPIFVVDAEPRSRQARDPEKVSHYVHRIGYHFKTEVVEQAVEELGYVYNRGNYTKEDELRTQRQQQFVTEVLQRHGIHFDAAPVKQENEDKVRAAIKELFPKIPELDLKEIVEHAWEEGTGRVGTQEHLDLPRRVQLATIARIRHNYTDYDRLLGAFGWINARTMVEQDSLAKLLEWRGENDIEDDNAFEEIVRETITIEDESSGEEGLGGSEADDEETDVENGHTEVQYTHRVAAAEDLRPESAHEVSRSHYLRYDPRVSSKRQYDESSIRQKIGEAREALRTGNITNVFVPSDGRASAPEQVLFGGQRFVLKSPTPPPLPPPPGYVLSPPPPPPPNYPPPANHLPAPGYPSFAAFAYQPQYGHVAPSPAQVSMQRLRSGPPVSLPHEQPGQYEVVRPSIEYDTPSTRRPQAYRQVSPATHPETNDHFRGDDRQIYRSNITPPRRTEVIDLTTPERGSRSGNPSPMKDVRLEPQRYGESQRYLQPAIGRLHERSPLVQSEMAYAPQIPQSGYYQESQQSRQTHHVLEVEPYDPTQPLLRFSERESRHDPHNIHRRQIPAWRQQNEGWIPAEEVNAQYQGLPQYNVMYPQGNGGQQVYQVVGYQEAPTKYYLSASGHTPQPVHGAPAPVQQMQLDPGQMPRDPRGW